MLRLSAVVLVHCALWVWTSEAFPRQLVPDVKDQCRFIAGDTKFANNPTMTTKEVCGKRQDWSPNFKSVHFPSNNFRGFPNVISYIEVTDLNCQKSTDYKGIFAAVQENGIGHNRVLIMFDQLSRINHCYKVVIRGISP